MRVERILTVVRVHCPAGFWRFSYFVYFPFLFFFLFPPFFAPFFLFSVYIVILASQLNNSTLRRFSRPMILLDKNSDRSVSALLPAGFQHVFCFFLFFFLLVQFFFLVQISSTRHKVFTPNDFLGKRPKPS